MRPTSKDTGDLSRTQRKYSMWVLPNFRIDHSIKSLLCWRRFGTAQAEMLPHCLADGLCLPETQPRQAFSVQPLLVGGNPFDHQHIRAYSFSGAALGNTLCNGWNWCIW